MKKYKLIITVVLTALVFAYSALPALAVDTTLALNPNPVLPDGQVTASGITDSNSWVPIKVLDEDNNIVFFDTVKSDSNGDYSLTFTVQDSDGTLTVVAGSGTNVEYKTLTVDDVSAPQWPTGSSLTTNDISQSSLTLQWTAATDDLYVSSYRIYKDNVLIGTVGGGIFTYSVTGLSAGTTYTFNIEAGDADGNWSTDGPSKTATTLSSGGGAGGGGTTAGTGNTSGTSTIDPDNGGSVNFNDEVEAEIPAGALQGSDSVSFKVEKIDAPATVPSGFKILGSVYQFTVDGSASYKFNSTITLTFTFDPSLVKDGDTVSVYYYDEAQGEWVNIGGTVSGSTITVQIDHFTDFAVLSGAAAETVNLTDIAGHWAEDNINTLVSLGAVSGYPDGSFKPDRTITRAEFVTILVKALNLTQSTEITFEDTETHWAKEYIAIAVANGIVNGYSADSFGPDDPITREQMAVMIANAADLNVNLSGTDFADSNEISSWAQDAVKISSGNNIITGYPNGAFKPHAYANRAEAVTVIVRIL